MKTGKESRQNSALFSYGRVATTVRTCPYGGADLSVRRWIRVHTVPGKASHLRFCVNRMKIPTHSDGRILKYVSNFSLEEMKLSKYASAENAQSGNYDREIRRMASLCQFASSLTARTGSAYACPEQVKGSTTLTSPGTSSYARRRAHRQAERAPGPAYGRGRHCPLSSNIRTWHSRRPFRSHRSSCPVQAGRPCRTSSRRSRSGNLSACRPTCRWHLP